MVARAAQSTIDKAGPGEQFFAITPSDATNFPFVVRAIYVGVTGNVVAINEAGTAVTFTAVPAGTVLPIYAQRVNSTSTTATNLVGMY